jgi:hypothetical protein
MTGSRRLGRVLLATAVVTAVAGGLLSSADAGTSGPAIAPASASASVAASRVAHPGTNLLRNGDAETGAYSFRGYDEVVIPGWSVTKGLPTVVRYGIKGFLQRSSPGPSDRGLRYFAGGSGGTGRLYQNVPLVSPHGGPVPRGARVRVSGWLGGVAGSTDDASVKLTFRGTHGSRLGQTRLGRVHRTAERGRSALRHESTAARVPVGTRSVTVTLVLSTSATNYDGPHGSAPGANLAWADDLSLTANAPVRAPRRIHPAKGFVPRYKHVFVVMMENQDYSNIIGDRRKAPFLNSLLSQGTSFASMYAEVHPSDPNYLALSAGSTFHVMGDPIESHRQYLIDARNIGDLVQDAGETWRAYYQGAHGPCDNTIHAPYYNDDLPFLYFQDIRSNTARCDRHLVPLHQMGVDLHSTRTTPNYAWWGANDCRDMEGCGIRSGDSFLRRTVGEIRSSPAWRKQRSILFITFDEDRYDKERPAQLIPTIAIASKGVKKGYVTRVRYDHYNMLRTIEAALQLGTLTKNDLYARPMSNIFTHRRQ